MASHTPDELAALLRDVPDFPEPGIVFKDITPLLGDAGAFASSIEHLAAPFRDAGIDVVVGTEARGFLFGTPVALALGAGFVPLRKPGKLPWQTVEHAYDLEYGTDSLSAHVDALAAGARALVVDDVLATGGTAAASCALVESLGGEVVACAFLLELGFLGGRSRLGDRTVHTVIDG